MPSAERSLPNVDSTGEPSLRRFAFEYIEYTLEYGGAPAIDHAAAPASWRELRACFVTLRKQRELRGCMGTFDATQPVLTNVAVTANRAAFADPRFLPVVREELPLLEVEVSLLGPTRPFPVASRADLLARLVPGVDGLIFHDGARHATFLPAVWESLPKPSDFVDELLRKAGLPADHWSPDTRFEQFTATKAS